MSDLPSTSPREAVRRAIARRERRQANSHWRRFGVLAAVVLAGDQGLKAIVRATLAPREQVDVFPGFDLTRVRNDGIAFGLFPGRPGAVAILTVVALCAIAVALAGLVNRNVLVATGAGLLVGGSLGNLIDRLAYGSVTDFLDPVGWPAFNLADVGIVVGAAIIVLGLLRDDEVREGAPDP